MNLPPNHILLSVNLSQLDVANISGIELTIGNKYNENERESRPVLARVERGMPGFKKGTWILCHYNLFDTESPRLLYAMDGLHYFSTEVDDLLFAIVGEDGRLQPICGNILAQRVPKATQMFGLDIPEEYQEMYHDRVRIISGVGGFREGDIVLTEKWADYEICYNWQGEQRRVVKILAEEVCGILTDENATT